MKRLLTFALAALLTLFLAAPAIAANSQTKAQRQAQKDWNKWYQQQVKAERKLIKQQNKMLKNWNRTHPVRTVTR